MGLCCFVVVVFGVLFFLLCFVFKGKKKVHTQNSQVYGCRQNLKAVCTVGFDVFWVALKWRLSHVAILAFSSWLGSVRGKSWIPVHILSGPLSLPPQVNSLPCVQFL